MAVLPRAQLRLWSCPAQTCAARTISSRVRGRAHGADSATSTVCAIISDKFAPFVFDANLHLGTWRSAVVTTLEPPSLSVATQLVYSPFGKLADAFDEIAWLILRFRAETLVSRARRRASRRIAVAASRVLSAVQHQMHPRSTAKIICSILRTTPANSRHSHLLVLGASQRRESEMLSEKYFLVLEAIRRQQVEVRVVSMICRTFRSRCRVNKDELRLAAGPERACRSAPAIRQHDLHQRVAIALQLLVADAGDRREAVPCCADVRRRCLRAWRRAG